MEDRMPEVVVWKFRRNRLPKLLRGLAANAHMEPGEFLAHEAEAVETQAELARRIGVSRETVMRWLRLCNVKWVLK
jgi:response regulator of citrate/malate metabolism